MSAPTPDARRTVLLLALVMFTSGADMLIMTPILPQVAAELGVTVEQGGAWVSVYAGCTAIVALIFGPISDRFGRRPLLIIGFGVIVTGTIACGLSSTYGELLAARALTGGGAGILVTSTTAFVGDHFAPADRALAMGYVMGGFFASLILAMPIGAFLADLVGWQPMFLVFAGGAAVVWLLAALFLPHPSRASRTTELRFLASLRTYARLVRDRRVLGVLLMSASIGLAMTMFSVYASPWLEGAYGLATRERGLVYAVGGPAALIGGPLAGRLSDRFGRVRVIVLGSASMAVMQLLMPSTQGLALSIVPAFEGAPLFGRIPWPAALPTLALFFGVMLSGSARSTPFQTLALEVVPAETRGALSALRNSFNQAGSSVGAALGATLWARTSGDFSVICYVAAGATVLGFALLRGLVGRDPPPL